MKKNNLLIAAFAGLAAASGAMAETGTVGNLAVATTRISSIDMNKNAGEAGKVLDSFYTGASVKMGPASPAVRLESGGRTLAQAEKEVCNAKAKKITGRPSEVPALAPGSGKQPARIDASAIAGQNRSWSDDLQTVVNDGPGYIIDNFNAKCDAQHKTNGTAGARG